MAKDTTNEHFTSLLMMVIVLPMVAYVLNLITANETFILLVILITIELGYFFYKALKILEKTNKKKKSNNQSV